MGAKAVTTPRPMAEVAQGAYGTEVTQFHTRLLRVALAIEESRDYWEHIGPAMAKPKRSEVAFEQRWFGSKSLPRVQRLLAELSHRYDAYPVALEVLMHWQPIDPVTRQNICHWHLQLTDPMYRLFTGDFLVQRRAQTATIDRDITARWVTRNLPTEWATATVLRMASALLTCATAAGICVDGAGSRTLTYPKVTDEALAYWMYFLRGLGFEGTVLNNAYFASVGLSDSLLEQRLSKLPGLSFSRMGDLYEFAWQYPDLQQWAMGELDLDWEVTS